MLSEQSRRVGRCYHWGIGSCLALAMAAGTATAQHHQQDQTGEQKESVQVTGEDLQVRSDLDKQKKHDKKEQGAILGMDEPRKDDWKPAARLPISKDLVLSGKTADHKDVQIVYTDGRIQSAKLDGSDIQHDRIKFKQADGKGKVKVCTDDGEGELITFMLPQQILATGPDRSGMAQDDYGFEQQRFGTNEQQWRQDGSQPHDRTMMHERADQGIDYWHNRNWDVHEFDARQSGRTWDDQRWDDRDWNGQSPATWENRRTDTRFERRSEPQFRERDARFDMRDDRMYRTETYGPGRFEPQQTYRADTQDRFDSRGMQVYRSDTRPERFESRQTYRADMDAPRMHRTETRTYSTGPAGDRSTLGVQLREVEGQELRTITREYSHGLRVQRVQRGGMADEAGLRPGDVIVRIDGRPADADLLRDALEHKSRMGEDLRLTVVRNNQTRTIAVMPSQATRFSGRDMLPENQSTLDHFDMPNIQHPGDSSYSPGGDFRTDRRIYSTDRNYDVRYERDTRFDRDFDRDIRIEQRWDSTYDRDMYRDNRSRDMRSQSWDRDVGADRDTRFEARVQPGNRIYGTTDVDTWDAPVYDRDVTIRDRTIDGRMRDRSYLDLEMPNVQHPGPFNLYRPTKAEEGPRR